MKIFDRTLALAASTLLFAAPALAQQYTAPIGGQAVYAAPSYTYAAPQAYTYAQPAPTYAAPAQQPSFGPQDSAALYGYGSPRPAFDHDWTGCYLGGYGGAAFSGQAYAGPLVTPRGGPIGGYYARGINQGYNYSLGDSALGGGTVGCNLQFGNTKGYTHFVVGAEGEGGLLDIVGNGYQSYGGGYGRYDKTSISDWDAIAAGRLGIAIGRGLIYGKAGVFFANSRTPVNETCPGCTFYGNDERTITGGAYGGGLEYALSNAWSLKAEYMYLDTASDFDVCGFEGSTPVCSHHELAGTHTLKLGLNYKFTGLFSRPAYTTTPRW